MAHMWHIAIDKGDLDCSDKDFVVHLELGTVII